MKSDEKENDLRLVRTLVSGLLTQNVTWFSSVSGFKVTQPTVIAVQPRNSRFLITVDPLDYANKNLIQIFHFKITGTWTVSTGEVITGVSYWSDNSGRSAGIISSKIITERTGTGIVSIVSQTWHTILGGTNKIEIEFPTSIGEKLSGVSGLKIFTLTLS